MSNNAADVPVKKSSSRQAGVVSLVDYRKAAEAATFLRGLFHEPAWLKDIRAGVEEDGTVKVLVVLRWQTPLIRACIPSAVNLIPVRQLVGADIVTVS